MFLWSSDVSPVSLASSRMCSSKNRAPLAPCLVICWSIIMEGTMTCRYTDIAYVQTKLKNTLNVHTVLDGSRTFLGALNKIQCYRGCGDFQSPRSGKHGLRYSEIYMCLSHNLCCSLLLFSFTSLLLRWSVPFGSPFYPCNLDSLTNFAIPFTAPFVYHGQTGHKNGLVFIGLHHVDSASVFSTHLLGSGQTERTFDPTKRST